MADEAAGHYADVTMASDEAPATSQCRSEAEQDKFLNLLTLLNNNKVCQKISPYLRSSMVNEIETVVGPMGDMEKPLSKANSSKTEIIALETESPESPTLETCLSTEHSELPESPTLETCLSTEHSELPESLTLETGLSTEHSQLPESPKVEIGLSTEHFEFPESPTLETGLSAKHFEFAESPTLETGLPSADVTMGSAMISDEPSASQSQNEMDRDKFLILVSLLSNEKVCQKVNPYLRSSMLQHIETVVGSAEDKEESTLETGLLGPHFELPKSPVLVENLVETQSENIGTPFLEYEISPDEVRPDEFIPELQWPDLVFLDLEDKTPTSEEDAQDSNSIISSSISVYTEALIMETKSDINVPALDAEREGPNADNDVPSVEISVFSIGLLVAEAEIVGGEIETPTELLPDIPSFETTPVPNIELEKPSTDGELLYMSDESPSMGIGIESRELETELAALESGTRASIISSTALYTEAAVLETKKTIPSDGSQSAVEGILTQSPPVQTVEEIKSREVNLESPTSEHVKPELGMEAVEPAPALETELIVTGIGASESDVQTNVHETEFAAEAVDVPELEIETVSVDRVQSSDPLMITIESHALEVPDATTESLEGKIESHGLYTPDAVMATESFNVESQEADIALLDTSLKSTSSSRLKRAILKNLDTPLGSSCVCCMFVRVARTIRTTNVATITSPQLETPSPTLESSPIDVNLSGPGIRGYTKSKMISCCGVNTVSPEFQAQPEPEAVAPEDEFARSFAIKSVHNKCAPGSCQERSGTCEMCGSVIPPPDLIYQHVLSGSPENEKADIDYARLNALKGKMDVTKTEYESAKLRFRKFMVEDYSSTGFVKCCSILKKTLVATHFMIVSSGEFVMFEDMPIPPKKTKFRFTKKTKPKNTLDPILAQLPNSVSNTKSLLGRTKIQKKQMLKLKSWCNEAIDLYTAVIEHFKHYQAYHVEAVWEFGQEIEACYGEYMEAMQDEVVMANMTLSGQCSPE